jgi:hypothetical protein
VPVWRNSYNPWDSVACGHWREDSAVGKNWDFRWWNRQKWTGERQVAINSQVAMDISAFSASYARFILELRAQERADFKFDAAETRIIESKKLLSTNHRPLAAPSFNGRTADSGSAYRGSNPWGAAKSNQQLT